MNAKKAHPTVYIIAGANGSGKTTFALEFLPEIVGPIDFINADLIAKGLSPFDSDKMVIQAGRLFLNRIKELIILKKDFAFETTLSGRSYLTMIKEMKRLGYKIRLYYLWIPNYQLAVERIRNRVHEGGHNVPEPIVKRRFYKTLSNLFHLYLPLINYLEIFDNSSQKPRSIFEREELKSKCIDLKFCNDIMKEVNWNESKE